MNKLIDEFARAIGRMDVATIREFIEADECCLALESLCEDIDELEIRLTREQFNEISRLGEHLGVARVYWEDLETLVIGTTH